MADTDALRRSLEELSQERRIVHARLRDMSARGRGRGQMMGPGRGGGNFVGGRGLGPWPGGPDQGRRRPFEGGTEARVRLSTAAPSDLLLLKFSIRLYFYYYYYYCVYDNRLHEFTGLAFHRSPLRNARAWHPP